MGAVANPANWSLPDIDSYPFNDNIQAVLDDVAAKPARLAEIHALLEQRSINPVAGRSRTVEMKFKPTIKLEHRAQIAGWLGDSQVWMETGVEKHTQFEQSGRTNHSVYNVGHVCAGIAFELVFMALAVSESRPYSKKHGAVKNFSSLGKESRQAIKAIIEQVADCSLDDFLKYLDERMSDSDRKYWGYNKEGGGGGVGFVVGIRSFLPPTLAVVHGKIADMVGRNTFQVWQDGQRIHL